MKKLTAAILVVVGIAAITIIGETRTGTSAVAYQRGGQPLFLDYTGEFDFIPAANTSLNFQNPVRIRNVNFPWVQVEPLPAPAPTRMSSTEIWVNMDHIAAIRKRR